MGKRGMKWRLSLWWTGFVASCTRSLTNPFPLSDSTINNKDATSVPIVIDSIYIPLIISYLRWIRRLLLTQFDVTMVTGMAGKPESIIISNQIRSTRLLRYPRLPWPVVIQYSIHSPNILTGATICSLDRNIQVIRWLEVDALIGGPSSSKL